jgi:transposase
VKKHKKLTKDQQAELASFIEDTGHKSTEVRRAQAVLLLDVESPVAIIHNLTRFSLRRAQELRSAYLATGTDALTDHRRSNHDRVLTRPEREQVTETLKTKQPKEILVICNVE